MKRELVLSVDWGQDWPLSDIMWWEEDQPNWSELIDSALIERLRGWAAFFNENADWETGSFGGESNRRWFEAEGKQLLEALNRDVGDRYDVVLKFWFGPTHDERPATVR